MKLIEVYRMLAKIYMEITWKEPGGLFFFTNPNPPGTAINSIGLQERVRFVLFSLSNAFTFLL